MAARHGSLRREIAETLRPPPGSSEGVLPPLMVLLTVVTGIVDAVAYLRLGHVFVANMTGNVVFLGFAAAGAKGLSVVGSLLAIGCFLPGGVAAGRLASRAGGDRARQLGVAAAIQATLIAAAIAVAAGSDLGEGGRYGLIVLLALAMGVQNATARRLAVRDMTTTVLTLTLTGIAADSRLGGGSGAGNGRRALSVAAMALGALLGALLLLELAPVAALVLAEALVVVVYAAARRAPGRAG